MEVKKRFKLFPPPGTEGVQEEGVHEEGVQEPHGLLPSENPHREGRRGPPVRLGGDLTVWVHPTPCGSEGTSPPTVLSHTKY